MVSRINWDKAGSPELVVAEEVRSWAETVLPGEDGVARTAVATALGCYAGGSSVAEACEAGRQVIGSWSRHPSRRRPARPRLAVAS